MNPSRLSVLLFALFAISCNPKNEILLEVTNQSDLQRNDATILLSRSEISKWTEIRDDYLPILQDQEGNYLPCQADDLNGDGTWDELFACTDMAPKQQRKLFLRFIEPSDYPEFTIRTNLRLGDATQPGYPELKYAKRLEGVSYHNYSKITGATFQMEGVAWENDRVGFRNYLDQRNGMDIFGKLLPEMVLDEVGLPGTPSYHEPNAWGMDVLKVGTSLGAGGIGYMHKDSIYRVGDNGSGSYEALFEGSQRSRFKLDFSNWNVDGKAIEVIQQVDISAGKHYYESTVTYTGPEMNMDLVAGIVNMKSDELYVLKLGDHHTALVTHDLQSEDTTMLTMALLIPNENLIRHGKTKEQGEGVTQTYYAVMEAHPGDPVPYRFYALWEKEDSRWNSLDEVTVFLEEEAGKWARSLDIKLVH